MAQIQTNLNLGSLQKERNKYNRMLYQFRTVDIIQKSCTHSLIIFLEVTLTTPYQKEVMLILVKCLWVTSWIKVPQSGITLQAALSTNLKNPVEFTIREFKCVDEEDVRRIVTAIQIKHCELHAVPTKIIKWICDKILPLITYGQHILITGEFSMNWKTAIVKLLLKKSGLHLIPKKYRLVSTLSFMSKVVNKVAITQFIKDYEDDQLMPD